MGDESEALRDGLGRDKHIHPADRRFLTFTVSANSSVNQRGVLIKNHNFQGQGILFFGRTFRNTVLKLGNGNRGNTNVTRDKLLKAIAYFRRFVFDHVDADIRI